MSKNVEQSNHTANRLGRRPELNVIYFVDAKRTRSFRLSLTAVRGLVCAFGLMVVWSLASFFFLAQSHRDQAQHRDRIASSMATIFDYQVRYDQVYELSYPNSQELLATLNNFEAGTNALPIQEKEAHLAEKKVVVPPAQARKQATEVKTAAPKPTASIAAALASNLPPDFAAEDQDEFVDGTDSEEVNPNEFNVKIENPRLKIENSAGDVNIHFAIRNQNSPKRAEGFVYGVAEFVTKDGKRYFVASPSSLQLDSATGEPKNLPEAFRYSIRYYKAKDFAFSAPAGLAGNYDRVKLVVTSKSGKSESVEVTVPDQPTDISVQEMVH